MTCNFHQLSLPAISTHTKESKKKKGKKARKQKQMQGTRERFPSSPRVSHILHTLLPFHAAFLIHLHPAHVSFLLLLLLICHPLSTVNILVQTVTGTRKRHRTKRCSDSSRRIQLWDGKRKPKEQQQLHASVHTSALSHHYVPQQQQQQQQHAKYRSTPIIFTVS